MNTSKKAQLEKEATEFQQQADLLKSRRQDLQNQLESTTLEHEKKRKQAGTDLLELKSITGLSTALAQTEANRTALQEAIVQADENIRLLEEQARDKRLGAKMSVFFDLGEDANARNVFIINLLYELKNHINKNSAVYGEMENISPLEHGGDDILIMHLIFKSIASDFEGLDGMTVKLQGFENNYQPFLAKARAKLK